MKAIRRKIIYVDDVNHSLLSLKDRLKNKYEIYPAQTVKILFEILENVKPDLILLDVNMPDIDGFNAIQMLKSDSRYACIPVVFLTGKNDKDSVFKGLNLGAAAYVSKPFSTEALVEQIEGIFNPYDRRKPYEELLPGEDCSCRPCILAVDDVPMMLRTIQSVLREQYKVYGLTDPGEIKTFLQGVTPDLILLDYKMPGLSGFDLVPIIRAFPEHQETPIIFITADGTFDRMITAAGLGACDFIVKPIETEVLREKVAKHLKWR
jgi:DNA-binding response OmpR family regulator